MVKNQPKPAWWVLYALIVLMLVVLALESIDGLPTWANEVASIGIVLMVFSGMMLWVRLNSASLWHEELRNLDPREFKIVEYQPQQLELERSNGQGTSSINSADELVYSTKE